MEGLEYLTLEEIKKMKDQLCDQIRTPYRVGESFGGYCILMNDFCVQKDIKNCDVKYRKK